MNTCAKFLFNTKHPFIAQAQFKVFGAKAIFLLDEMLYLLFTVVLRCSLSISHQHHQQQHSLRGDHGLKRSRFQHGVSYANFVAHKFQHLQGSHLDSSCEVGQANECALVCVKTSPCVSFNIALLPNENGKFRCELLSEDMFRSPDNLTASQQFHHYSIKVCKS